MQRKTPPTPGAPSPAITANNTGMRPLPPRPSPSEMSAHLQRQPEPGLVPAQLWPNQPDIRHLTYEQRRNLDSGPPLRMICGDKTFRIPFCLFRAASKKVSHLDTMDPASPKLILIPMDSQPISDIIKWLQEVVTKSQAPHIALNFDPELSRTGRMKRDLAVVRAGKMLGFDVYVQDIFNYYWRHFKSGKLTYEDIDVVLSLTASKEDPFFCCIKDRLAMMKFKGWKWQGLQDYDEWVKDRPWLREAVETSLALLYS